MSAALSSPRVGFKFVLTIRQGPDVGTSFQLLPPQVTIGRGPECQLVLNDPRVSRNAAVIQFSMEEILITDTSRRQALSVNGQTLDSASLKDGDIIRLGDTEMTFFVESLDLRPPPPLSLYQGGSAHGSGSAAHGAGVAPPPAFHAGGLSKRQRFYLILGVVGLAFAGLLLSGGPAKKTDSKFHPDEEREEALKNSEKLQEKLSSVRAFKNDEERTRTAEANKHFAEGFRDYEKGQWVRAMRSFETVLTIEPKHQLARRYFRLAEKQRDQMIADLTLEGRRYRENNMFSRCSAQFEKVLDMIPNKDDAKFKLAESIKKECDLKLEGKYRYDLNLEDENSNK